MAEPVGVARPFVGVTTYLEPAVQGPWKERFALVPETYLLAVEDAGGAPILLPPQPHDEALVDRVLDSIDALVLTGGADVDPARYGQEPLATTQRPRTDRDAWEAALCAAAIGRGMPVLAICRGVQLLNVVLGGSLIQHLPDVIGSELHGPQPGVYGHTDVHVLPGTLLADLLSAGADPAEDTSAADAEPVLTVHCHHHQAIDRVAEGLVVAAVGDGGVIEAVELPEQPFVVGVQWHPEENAADRRLFAALIESVPAWADARG